MVWRSIWYSLLYNIEGFKGATTAAATTAPWWAAPPLTACEPRRWTGCHPIIIIAGKDLAPSGWPPGRADGGAIRPRSSRSTLTVWQFSYLEAASILSPFSQERATYPERSVQ